MKKATIKISGSFYKKIDFQYFFKVQLVESNYERKEIKMRKKIMIGVVLIILMISLTGCGLKTNTTSTESNISTNSTTNNTTSSSTQISSSDIFTDRDLEQSIDTSNATKYNVSDNKTITIDKEGIYVITGSAKNAQIVVNTDDESKVQLVLSDLGITNDNTPCIYVKNADKVFVTLTGSNYLTVNNTFTADGETNTDAVIFAKDDLVINGTGTLKVSSTDNGITSKDDLKITGGTISIDCTSDALEANNSIAISDGDITINTKKDGLHAEYDEDDSVGYIYISGGSINITASDDAIHATTTIQIDGGKITTNSKEGIEGTYIQINDGTINIKASDDGINAGAKSKSHTPTIEINGGEITIDMGNGDTDAVDSNGNIYINGGTLTINAMSPFDYDGNAEYKGGKIIVNGEETNEITNQMMGGPGGNNGQRGRR